MKKTFMIFGALLINLVLTSQAQAFVVKVNGFIQIKDNSDQGQWQTQVISEGNVQTCVELSYKEIGNTTELRKTECEDVGLGSKNDFINYIRFNLGHNYNPASLRVTQVHLQTRPGCTDCNRIQKLSPNAYEIFKKPEIGVGKEMNLYFYL